jgi:hypothetical protein
MKDNCFKIFSYYDSLKNFTSGRMTTVCLSRSKGLPYCLQYFSNPYLVSKLVEVLFIVNPSVQEKTTEIYARSVYRYIPYGPYRILLSHL